MGKRRQYTALALHPNGTSTPLKTSWHRRNYGKPKSQQKSRRRRGYEIIAGYGPIFRKRTQVSWNARRFDPTAKNLRRHLRHKSKWHEKFYNEDHSITEGELQGLRELAKDAGLDRIFMACIAAEHGIGVMKNMRVMQEERDDALKLLDASRVLVADLRDRIKNLEHTIERARDKRRERHGARGR